MGTAWVSEPRFTHAGGRMKTFHKRPIGRRSFLKGAGGVIASVTIGGCNSIEKLFQKHFLEMTPQDMEAVRARLHSDYKRKYGRNFVLGTEPAREGELYGYGLDISRCVGCRRCVYACVHENNQSGPNSTSCCTI